MLCIGNVDDRARRAFLMPAAPLLAMNVLSRFTVPSAIEGTDVNAVAAIEGDITIADVGVTVIANNNPVACHLLNSQTIHVANDEAGRGSNADADIAIRDVRVFTCTVPPPRGVRHEDAFLREVLDKAVFHVQGTSLNVINRLEAGTCPNRA